jgi:hypothetical protein
VEETHARWYVVHCPEDSFALFDFNTRRSTLSANQYKPLMTSELMKRRIIKASLRMRIRITIQEDHVTVQFSAPER